MHEHEFQEPLSASNLVVRPTIVCHLEDARITRWATKQLTANGFEAIPAASLDDTLRLLASVQADIVLLDADATTAEAVRQRVRRAAEAQDARVVMTSTAPLDRCGISADRCGAHVCIAKPVSANDLVTQVRRAVRQRRQPFRWRSSEAPLRVGPVELDRQWPQVRLYRVSRASCDELDLPEVEYRVLQLLMQSPGDALHRRDLAAGIWPDQPSQPRSVDQAVRRLRRYLSRIAAQDMVETVAGVGYRFAVPGD